VRLGWSPSETPLKTKEEAKEEAKVKGVQSHADPIEEISIPEEKEVKVTEFLEGLPKSYESPEEIFAAFTKTTTKRTSTQAWRVWSASMNLAYPDLFMVPPPKKVLGQLSHLLTRMQWEYLVKCIVYTIPQWKAFAKQAMDKSGLNAAPSHPHIGFFVQHVQHSLDRELTKKTPSGGGQLIAPLGKHKS
jgi:hypothetical protein